MSEELMITKEDLVNWLNRPPSNDDLDLIGFITTRLENFYKLEQENKQLKEKLDYDLKWALKYDELYEENKQLKSILTELEEWCKSNLDEVKYNSFDDILDKIQKLKEKYK